MTMFLFFLCTNDNDHYAIERIVETKLEGCREKVANAALCSN